MLLKDVAAHLLLGIQNTKDFVSRSELRPPLFNSVKGMNWAPFLHKISVVRTQATNFWVL